MGSNPTLPGEEGLLLRCSVARRKKGDCSSMVEQENFNLLVVGSSPISPIKRK